MTLAPTRFLTLGSCGDRRGGPWQGTETGSAPALRSQPETTPSLMLSQCTDVTAREQDRAGVQPTVTTKGPSLASANLKLGP